MAKDDENYVHRLKEAVEWAYNELLKMDPDKLGVFVELKGLILSRVCDFVEKHRVYELGHDLEIDCKESLGNIIAVEMTTDLISKGKDVDGKCGFEEINAMLDRSANRLIAKINEQK